MIAELAMTTTPILTTIYRLIAAVKQENRDLDGFVILLPAHCDRALVCEIEGISGVLRKTKSSDRRIAGLPVVTAPYAQKLITVERMTHAACTKL